MKSTIKKYGLYAALVGGIIFSGSHFLMTDIDFGLLEIWGYTSIFASLSFIFFGIKHFRDQLNNGIISFGKAMIIGLAISVISGLIIGILDIIYVTIINPDFVTEYLQYTFEGMKETMPAVEFEKEKIKLTQQMELFARPEFSGLLMFAIVFVIGLIISLISSLILQRKN